MQHDLFHVYTVDEHILMVIRNLRRFTEAAARARVPAVLATHRATSSARKCSTSPACSTTSRKGRGGDHSMLGARDARRFCRAARLADGRCRARRLAGRAPPRRCRRRRRSRTSPIRRSSPRSPRRSAPSARLIALYLLTVADIRGTSPRVWNAWKAQAPRGSVPRDARVAGRRCGAAQTLSRQRCRRGSVEAQRSAAALRGAGQTPSRRCGSISTRPISSATRPRRSPGTRATCTGASSAAPVGRRRGSRAPAPACRCVVYLPDQKELFARICGFFGRAGLSILEAKVHTTRHGYALDTFAVHDPRRPVGVLPRRPSSCVEFELTRSCWPNSCRSSRRRQAASRQQLEAFPADAADPDLSRRQGHALHPGDRRRRPARACSRTIAYMLAQANVNVASAKINTLGERAEDVFLDRRRAAARRAGAAAPGDGAVRGSCDVRRGVGVTRPPRVARPGTARRCSRSARNRACASGTGCQSGDRTRAGRPARGSPSTSRRIGCPADRNPS